MIEELKKLNRVKELEDALIDKNKLTNKIINFYFYNKN